VAPVLLVALLLAPIASAVLLLMRLPV